ncbi:hypothetical protein BGZ65_002878 [Modicella reniformis]|uniref:Uncharacterized protein n=1 Tax=Modicella reniformis TaxID=1440133 RepID=A0A9P6LSU2_9FUNG|nr:hypothetical protein BGZ65_002878 [Modicella reniformis]
MTIAPYLILLATKFVAKFEERRVGHFVVRWRVKLLQHFYIPTGLRFSVAVSFDAELADMAGSFDVGLSHEELEKLDVNQSYDLQLEELVVVQPHEGNAAIELSLSNTESERRLEYSGLQVEFVEIKPFTAVNEANRGDKAHCEEGVKSDSNLMEAPHFWTLKPPGTSSDIPITRLAWSKDGSFLTALAVGKTSAHITVWDTCVRVE